MTKEEYNYYLKGQVIKDILNSDYDSAIKLFVENAELLKDVNFIIPHPKADGLNYMEEFKSLNMDGIDVNYFFTSERLYCFNYNSVFSDLLSIKYFLKIEQLVCLDTQILSYLYRKYINKENSIPENIDEVLKLIKDRKWGVDCFAYSIENTLFDSEFSKQKVYKDNLYAFETYFFNKYKQAKSYANKMMKLTRKIFNDDFANWYKRQYKLYYLELLVMTDIKINKANLNLYDKEDEFAKFFHNQIGMLSDREMNLAKIFFEYGTKIGFFGKIQKGNKNLIKNLKNMAWDIFHIHNTINNITMPSERILDFTIPYFVTYDKRLRDILPIYKIKSVAFDKKSFNKFIIYTTDLIDPIIKNKYLVLTSMIERQQKLKNKEEKDIISIIDHFIEIFECKIKKI